MNIAIFNAIKNLRVNPLYFTLIWAVTSLISSGYFRSLYPTFSVSIYMSTFKNFFCFKLLVQFNFQCKIIFQNQFHSTYLLFIFRTQINLTLHISYLYFLDQSHSTYFDYLMQLICEQPLFLNCVIFLKWTSNLKRYEYPLFLNSVFF